MKYRFASSPRAAAFALSMALGASAPFLAQVAHAAPKEPQLEIWPAQRVLLVLPLQVSPTWNADAQLGRAILPLAQPQLQQALTNTGKFSVTLPYRFDPVLRRGLAEKQNNLAEKDITTLLAAPTLVNSRPVIDKLAFEQPVMTTEVFLEELTIGGDSKKPTVQLQVSGRLYEQNNPTPVRTETYRSKAVEGKTPSDRLTAAAQDAFKGLAMMFVMPPVAFDLPAPIEVAPPEEIDKKTGKKIETPGSAATGSKVKPAAPGMSMAPAPLPSTATPNPLPAAPRSPLVPQLPTGQPPLGVTAGETGVAGR